LFKSRFAQKKDFDQSNGEGKLLIKGAVDGGEISGTKDPFGGNGYHASGVKGSKRGISISNKKLLVRCLQKKDNTALCKLKSARRGPCQSSKGKARERVVVPEDRRGRTKSGKDWEETSNDSPERGKPVSGNTNVKTPGSKFQRENSKQEKSCGEGRENYL